MSILPTQITPTSPEYAANAKAMRSLVSELQALLAAIAAALAFAATRGKHPTSESGGTV